jgi:outer membrane protein assembly factor BamB
MFEIQIKMAGQLASIKNIQLAGMLIWLLLSSGFLTRVRAEVSPVKINEKWSFRFVSHQPYNSSSSTPAMSADGTIYVGTFDGTFYAVTASGKEKWRFKAGREIKSSPSVADDGTVYFGSRDRKFYALTPDGKLKWVFQTGAWVDSSPAIALDGTIYFGGWDGNFYALKPDGSVKWKFTVGAIVTSSPAIAADGTIYFGAHDKFFYALNPDGTVRWKFIAGANIISSPAIGRDGIIYFTALDGNLYALRPDGTEKWHYHSGSPTESSPVLNEADDICIGINLKTIVISAQGQFLWNCNSSLPMEVSEAAANGCFYISQPWRLVAGFTNKGKPLWQTDLPENVSSSFMVGQDGTVYFCAEQRLYAVHSRGESMSPVKSAWPMFRANARHTGRVNN